MKFSPYVFVFMLAFLGLNSLGFAKSPSQNPSFLTKACNIMFMALGWQDGQAISLNKVQEMIHTMQLPAGYNVTPRSAVTLLSSLNASQVPNVVFQCTSDDQPLAPNTVAKFYFSYMLPDNTPMQTPEFTVTKKPTDETGSPSATPQK